MLGAWGGGFRGGSMAGRQFHSLSKLNLEQGFFSSGFGPGDSPRMGHRSCPHRVTVALFGYLFSEHPTTTVVHVFVYYV